jgi:hypothetical protein
MPILDLDSGWLKQPGFGPIRVVDDELAREFILEAGHTIFDMGSGVGETTTTIDQRGMRVRESGRYWAATWCAYFADWALHRRRLRLRAVLLDMARSYADTLEAAWRIAGKDSLRWSARDLLVDVYQAGDQLSASEKLSNAGHLPRSGQGTLKTVGVRP